MSKPRPRRLLILACSATKTKDPGRIPAYQRYNGPLWQTLRTVDPGRELAAVAFVSARFGFKHACYGIEDYDARLTPELARQMIEGGLSMLWPHKPQRGRTIRMPIGTSAIQEMGFLNGPHELAEQVGAPPKPAFVFNDAALVGGGLYLEVMRSLVAGFVAYGNLASDARVVEINGPIGIMRSQLGAWLRERSATAQKRSATKVRRPASNPLQGQLL